jgi:hypothetical protein
MASRKIQLSGSIISSIAIITENFSFSVPKISFEIYGI